MQKNKKAFTLIEVIVALAILAILATISVAVFLGFEDTSNNKVCLSQRTSAKRMYEMYIAFHEEHNVDGTQGMYFLLESGFLSEPYACPDGGQYSWKVEDGHVSVYVDDIKVMDFVDDTFTEGSVGCRTWSTAEVSMENLSVQRKQQL